MLFQHEIKLSALVVNVNGVAIGKAFQADFWASHSSCSWIVIFILPSCDVGFSRLCVPSTFGTQKQHHFLVVALTPQTTEFNFFRCCCLQQQMAPRRPVLHLIRDVLLWKLRVPSLQHSNVVVSSECNFCCSLHIGEP